MRGSILVVALALAPALIPAPARAAEPSAEQRAVLRRKFDEAIEFTKQKRWLEALDLLRAIAREKDTGGVRFYMAMCEENLAQLRAAEASYEAAIRLSPVMGLDEAVVIARRSEEALARLRPRIPQVTLRADPAPAGLAVSIDGRPLSADELTRPVPHDPGEARVKATAPGRVPFEGSVTLSEGARLTLDLILNPVPAAEPPPPSPSPPPPPPPPPARWPAYLTGAVALGAAGTGVGFYLRHRRLDDETDRVCAEALRCDPARQDRLSLYRNVALASAGVAVAAGVVTVVLWRSASTDTHVAVGPQSVTLLGRW